MNARTLMAFASFAALAAPVAWTQRAETETLKATSEFPELAGGLTAATTPPPRDVGAGMARLWARVTGGGEAIAQSASAEAAPIGAPTSGPRGTVGAATTTRASGAAEPQKRIARERPRIAQAGPPGRQVELPRSGVGARETTGLVTTGHDGALTTAVAGRRTPDGPPAQRPPIDRAAQAAIASADPIAQMTFWAGQHHLYSDDIATVRGFSESLRRGGRFQRAAEVASAGLSQWRGDLELTRTLGLARLASGDAEGAVRVLSAVVDADRADWRARSALGAAYDQLGKPQRAREIYQSALAIRPEEPAVLTNLGMSYLLTGEPERAEEILRHAASLPGAATETRQNLAVAVGLQGRFAEAEELQRAELPPAMVANNMAYIRSLIVDGRRWGDLAGTAKQ